MFKCTLSNGKKSDNKLQSDKIRTFNQKKKRSIEKTGFDFQAEVDAFIWMYYSCARI